MKKIIFSIILLTCFHSCNKKDKSKNYLDKEISSKTFKEEQLFLKKYQYIFDGKFDFQNGIIIDKIGLVETKENIYQTIIVLNKKTDLKKLEGLKFAMYFYPSDSLLIDNKKDRSKGFVKTGISTKVFKVNNINYLKHDNFKITPKNHKSIRFYFYKEKIVGDNLYLYNIVIK